MVINGINRLRGFEPVVDAPSDVKLPVRGSSFSAGYDFFAPCDITVPAMGFSDIIALNVKAYMQPGEVLLLMVRSSLALRDFNGHLIAAQGTGVIDADYYSNVFNDGNIGVMFYNRTNHDVTINKGERCCQGIFTNYLVADNDSSLGSRNGGYGSTGK